MHDPRTLLAVVLLTAAPTALASPIFYEAENLSGDRWEYTYTVGNETAGEIDWFTIFFAPDLYAFDTIVVGPDEEVDPDTFAGATDWDVIVAAPEPLFPGSSDNQPGFYDAFAFGDPVFPGSRVSGFTIAFTWLGDGAPGSQPFTLFGEDLLPVLGDNLFTEPLNAGPVPVPEPGTLGLLTASVALLGFARRGPARP
jgi:hypothetical protein